MIRRLLIANRGEIARRVIRTCRRLGVETVAVFSDADAQAPHVREADRAVRLGPPPASESYLRGDLVVVAARETGADAVHPGYGFLSENAEFAEAVTAAGLVWVGPPPSAIRAMGLKDAAKTLMAQAGVPVTPGYLGDDQSEARLQAEADRIGYPVLIKAVAGGGGKGMRRVDEPAAFREALGAAKREAAAAFGDDRVLLETYVTRPRHIEVQVFADRHGSVVHLFERDCSLQRRHQKVIEEAPAPGMDAATREAVTSAAVRAAEAVGYEGAGTVEFIADASEGLRGDRIFFMEMNTRLQVEHPVTEMITGQDLVEWQLRVASGEPLPLRQDQLSITGHAMEARLYAENPATGFLPSTGKLDHFRLPSEPLSHGERAGPARAAGGEVRGYALAEVPTPSPSHAAAQRGPLPLPPGEVSIRIDSAVEQGGEVSVFYDPMIAKLIAHAPMRETAAAALADACRRVEVWPVRTNAAFLARCLDHPDFLAGEVDTGFIPARLDALTEPRPLSAAGLAAAGAEALLARQPEGDRFDAPWDWGALAGWRLNAPSLDRVLMFDGSKPVAVPVAPGAASGSAWAKGGDILVFDQGEAVLLARHPPVSGSGEAAGDGAIIAPMPGRIVSVDAAPGVRVAKGAKLVTLEAMKMEQGLLAPFDGVVAEVSAAPGAQVAEGAILVRLDPA